MEAAQWRLVPGDALTDVVDGPLVITVAEEDAPAVEAFGPVAGPGVDRGEVVKLRDGTRRRGEVTARSVLLRIELDAVEHVRGDLEGPVVAAAEQLLAKARKPSRVVQLVAVDAEHPGIRAGIGLDQLVGLSRVMSPPCVEVRVLARKTLKDLPGLVCGYMI